MAAPSTTNNINGNNNNNNNGLPPTPITQPQQQVNLDDMPLSERMKLFPKTNNNTKSTDNSNPSNNKISKNNKSNMTDKNDKNGVAAKIEPVKPSTEAKNVAPTVTNSLEAKKSSIDKRKLAVPRKSKSSDALAVKRQKKDPSCLLALELTKSIKTESTKTKKSKKEQKGPDSQDDEGENDDDDEYKWWEVEQAAFGEKGTVKWESLEHNGPYFPPPYEPINVPLLYEDKELYLEPEAEEVAGFFAALVNTDHAANAIFRENFFADFKHVLQRTASAHAATIKSLEACDWSKMHAYFEQQRELRRAWNKEQKEAAKAVKQEIDGWFGWCRMDGRKEKVGNFRIEPPGLFRGRGKHPKAGKLKERVQPEQVTINCSAEAKVPEPPLGRRWASVIHDNTVTWLATWTENVNKSPKYVMLAPGSSLKGQSDLRKFETARQLKSLVDGIRAKNREELHSKEMAVRQRATALWLIDNLALRAGNEKGDDEADTVGCCSLRLEHVTLKLPDTVVFDFLGKDSIRYHRELQVDPQIVKNLSIFMRPPKQPGDPIFDRLTTSSLNKYLGELMPGLTAKVFRTFNASHTFQRELDAAECPEGSSQADLILAYNRANRQVAILCNHQRTVPKTHSQSMERLREKMWALKYQRHLIRKRLKQEKSKETKSFEGLHDEESDFEVGAVESLLLQRHHEKLVQKKVKSESESKKDEKDDEDDAKNPVEDHQHKISNASLDALQKKWAAVNDRIAALRVQMTDRDENKTTALGTSKTNYIDPRITVAWCAEKGVPVEKMFNKSLRDKFKWAMQIAPQWKF